MTQTQSTMRPTELLLFPWELFLLIVSILTMIIKLSYFNFIFSFFTFKKIYIINIFILVSYNSLVSIKIKLILHSFSSPI